MTTHDSPGHEPTSSNVIGKRQGIAVGIAGILSAGIGLVALLITARILTIEDNTRFTLFWSVLFFTFGIMTGLTLETTRSVTVSRTVKPHNDEKRTTPTILVIAFITGIIVILLVGGTLPAWRLALPTLSGTQGVLIAIAIVIGLLGYAGQSILVGTLAGIGEWTLYATTIIAESSLRLILMVIAAVTGSGLVGFAFATVFAEYAWVGIVIFSRRARSAYHQFVDASGKLFAKRAANSMLGQGASALLLVGFPWLLGLTTSHDVFLGAAPLMLAISLTRAPLMVPVTAFQNVALSYFTRHHGAGGRKVFTMLGIIAVFGLVVAGLVYLVGPPLLHLVRPDYVISGSVLFGLTIGATSITMITLTGVLCQSAASYRAYITGWIVAILSAIVVLMTPFGLVTRTIAALVAGPLLGMATHLVFLLRRLSR